MSTEDLKKRVDRIEEHLRPKDQRPTLQELAYKLWVEDPEFFRLAVQSGELAMLRPCLRRFEQQQSQTQGEK